MAAKIIEAKAVTLPKARGGGNALAGLSFEVAEGEYLAVLGKSNSGKSALAHALNATLPLAEGELRVAGYDVRDEKRRRQIRRSCGVVYADIESCFVSSRVYEELAFAPRAFGVEADKIAARVTAALEAVGMSGYERRSPQLLPAGQRARVALAAILTAEPEIIVLDSVTESLPPDERREFLKTVSRLHESGRTIVLLTNNAEDASAADRALLLADGRKLAEGAPRELLADDELMDKAGLAAPFAVRAAKELAQSGAWRGEIPLTIEELVAAVCL